MFLSEVTSTPTRPVDNVVITTKGLQDRNINILDRTTVENKGKLILIVYSSLGNSKILYVINSLVLCLFSKCYLSISQVWLQIFLAMHMSLW